MAALTGREIKAALAKAGTWRTAVECGVGSGLLLTELGGDPKIEMLKDDSFGQMYIKTIDKGKVTVEGTLGGYMRYDGLDLLIGLIMGACGTPAQQGATAAYTNSFTLADNTDGLFGTLASLRQSTKVWEMPSIKLTGLDLDGEIGGVVKFSCSFIADRVVYDSLVNTAGTMATVTYPESGNRLIMDKSFYFRMNDASGDALDSGDAIYPSKFKLSFKRPMEGLPEAGYEGVSEPASSNFPECTLTLEFPRYDAVNHQYFEDWDALTNKKIDIKFTGANIASTYDREFQILCPCAQVTDAKATVNGPGRIPTSITFELKACDQAPAGMSGITKPFQINVQNQKATSVLTASKTLVSIVVTPDDSSTDPDTTVQFTATAHYSDSSTADITNQVAWSSTDITKFTIDGTGLASTVDGVESGSSTIVATKDGISGETTLSYTT